MCPVRTSHPEKNQKWRYRTLKGIGMDVILTFTYKDGEYLWDKDPH